jgi:hypothetical protein
MKKVIGICVFAVLTMGCATTSKKVEIINDSKTTTVKMTKSKISFKRDGLTLVGNLFTPKNFDENLKYNAIIVQGSATSVKEQISELYAEKFAEEGFVVLAFDYSHYGESEGTPRQLEAPAEKLKDLEAAVSYLSNLSYVKNVAMTGVCTSGGNAAYLAVADTRVKAIATVAGFLPEPNITLAMYGEAEVARRREAAKAAKVKYENTKQETIVTAYSETDPTAANYYPLEGAFDYYLNKKRGAVPNYKNELAVMSWETFQDFDPISKSKLINIPTMVVHSDGSTFPDQAKKFYSQLQGKKELVWGEGNHFDFYDQPDQVNYAVKNVTRFFKQYLE